MTRPLRSAAPAVLAWTAEADRTGVRAAAAAAAALPLARYRRARTGAHARSARARAALEQLSIVNPYNLVYTAIIYFENNDFILKIIQYNWVYNIVGNLFLKI